jgi:GDP-L-fucose synthase
MVGGAILRRLAARGRRTGIITRTHAELDLTDQAAVRAFMAAERPDVVILAAAKVGGIHANNTYPADFIYDNLMIEANVIHQAHGRGETACSIWAPPASTRARPQPMAEDALLTGPLEPTNEPYAIAKIAGIKLCESYNRQYGTDYRSVMPTNLYGPGDNFHPENSHVLPALIRRFHEAVQAERGGGDLGHRHAPRASSCMSTTWPRPRCSCSTCHWTPTRPHPAHAEPHQCGQRRGYLHSRSRPAGGG